MLAMQTARYSARVVPEAGGIVAALDWHAPDGGHHALLHAPAGMTPSTAAPNMFGTWAMLPFANRAFGGLIDDGERRFPVPENNPRGGNIHGFGWQAPWRVLRYDQGHTVLEHRRVEGPDPYRYLARQEITLDGTGMTVAFSVTNEAIEALPYGIGHHPWFPCTADTRLGMTAGSCLTFGESFRATGSRPLANGGPYAGNPIFATGTETAWSFLDWDGTARIETPSRGLAITLSASETLRCPVVWAPAGADFLCVEPQSHVIGSPSEAPARAVSPLRRLQPGETLAGWLRIAADAI